MLSGDLLMMTRRNGIARPKFVDPAKANLLERAKVLIDLFATQLGRPRLELDAAIDELVGDEASQKLTRGLAKLLDDAKAHPAAPVHRHTGGLVEGQKVLVFEQQGEVPGRGRRLLFQYCRLRQPDGGHPDLVARSHPGIGRRAPLVHPDLSGSDDAVDMGLGHTLEVTQEEVVQALAGRFLVHRQDTNVLGRTRKSMRCGPYNAIH